MSWGWGENYEESDATADHDSELPTTPSECRLHLEQVSSDGPSYVSAPTCELCDSGWWCDDHSYLYVARARCFFNQLDVLTHNEKYVLHIGDQEDDFWTEYMDNDRYKHFQCPACAYVVFEIRSPTVMTPEPCKWCAWAAHTNECFSLRRLCTTGPQPGYRWPESSLLRCDPELKRAYLNMQRSSPDRVCSLLPARRRIPHEDRSRSPRFGYGRREPDREPEPRPQRAVMPEVVGPPDLTVPEILVPRYDCPQCKDTRSTERNVLCWWCLGQPGWRPDDPAHEFRIGRNILSMPGRDGLRLVPGRIL